MEEENYPNGFSLDRCIAGIYAGTNPYMEEGDLRLYFEITEGLGNGP